MNIKFTFFYSSLIILLFASCKSDDTNIIITQINLDEELTLSIRENFNENGPSGIIARLTSSTEYDCQEGQLKHNWTKNNNEIVINITGLDFPPSNECDGRDVAAADIDLGEIPQDLTQLIQISLLGEIKNVGTMVNRFDRISINVPSDSGSGINVDNNTVYKIPPGVIWGFIDSKIPVPDSIEVAFTNQIESLGSPIEKVGTFGHFLIESDGSAQINDFEKSQVSRNLGVAVNHDGDFEALSALVQSYCDDEYRVRLWDSNGNEFSCN